MSPSTVRSGRPSRAATDVVALELLRRVVEDRHGRPRRREHRSLLPAARGETQNVQSVQLGWEPVARHRLIADEHDGPVAVARPLDHVGPDRPGPLVASVDLAIPGRPVVGYEICWRSRPSPVPLDGQP